MAPNIVMLLIYLYWLVIWAIDASIYLFYRLAILSILELVPLEWQLISQKNG